MVQKIYANPVTGDIGSIEYDEIKWGEIQGDITNQTDLVTYINNQLPTIIHSLSDLPEPIEGIIYLNGDYIISGDVDLQGNKIVCNSICSITGISSETSILRSTGLTDYLITSNYSLPIQNISFYCDKFINIDGFGNNAALDWFAVNVYNCNDLGIIKNVNNFILISCLFNNSKLLQFDGTIGTISFAFTLFNNTSDSLITIKNSAIVSRRFRVSDSSFIASLGSNSISIENTSSIPTDQFILKDCNFSGGSTTFINGVTNTNNISDWRNNKGILNSSSTASYYLTTGITTPIPVVGTFYKLLGTTTAGDYIQRFTVTDNRATYIGAISSQFLITMSLSASSGNNQLLRFRIAKNGITIASGEVDETTNSANKVSNLSSSTIVSLNTGDYLEIFGTNNTNTTDILPVKMTVTIIKIT